MAGLLLDEIFSRDIDTEPKNSPDFVRFIDVDGELFASVYDVMGQTCLCTRDHASKLWIRFKERGIQGMEHKFPGQGSRKTPIMTYEGFQQMIPDVIASMRLPFRQKEDMLAGFDVEYTKPRVYIRVRAEDDIHGDIKGPQRIAD
jgi:hypothetical protein